MIQGTVGALGIQKKSAYLNAQAYWLIYAPLSYLISFKLGFGY
jgi:Na+-driven multidrug efflux pump